MNQQPKVTLLSPLTPKKKKGEWRCKHTCTQWRDNMKAPSWYSSQGSYAKNSAWACIWSHSKIHAGKALAKVHLRQHRRLFQASLTSYKFQLAVNQIAHALNVYWIPYESAHSRTCTTYCKMRKQNLKGSSPRPMASVGYAVGVSCMAPSREYLTTQNICPISGSLSEDISKNKTLRYHTARRQASS